MAGVAVAGASRAASSRPGVVIEGLDAVVSDLNRAGLTVGLRASKVVRKHAGELRQDMVDSVPRHEGTTARSIVATPPGGGSFGAINLSAEVGPTHFVGRFLAFGTVKMSPRWDPFALAERRVPYFTADLADVAGDV